MLDRLREFGTQDDFTRLMVSGGRGAFLCCRRLDDGTYIGIIRLAFTFGLCIGISPEAMFDRRYCYENAGDVIHEYTALLHGQQLPSGGWIARRPETPEYDEAKRRPHFDVKQFWGKL